MATNRGKEMDEVSKPKAVKRDNRIGSKTAPLEIQSLFAMMNLFFSIE